MKDLTLPTPALPPLATEIFHAVDNAMYAAGISAVDRQFVFDSVNASASVRAALSHHEDGGRAATDKKSARDTALEQAANLVECEYAADATQGRRLAQIAQHIRDLKKRGV